MGIDRGIIREILPVNLDLPSLRHCVNPWNWAMVTNIEEVVRCEKSLRIEVFQLRLCVEWMLPSEADKPWVASNPAVWGSSEKTQSSGEAQVPGIQHIHVLSVNDCAHLVCGHLWQATGVGEGSWFHFCILRGGRREEWGWKLIGYIYLTREVLVLPKNRRNDIKEDKAKELPVVAVGFSRKFWLMHRDSGKWDEEWVEYF